MYGQTINTFLAGLGAETLTDLTITVMTVLWVVSLLLAALGRCRRFTAQTATVLTSLGILGTFGGIVVGLYGFDSSPGRIDASVQTLLEGLKTAFTSSLVGMALAVTYKLLLTVPPFAVRERTPDAAPTTIAGTLEAMLAATRKQAEETGAIRSILEKSSPEALSNQLANVSTTLEQGFGELTKSAQAERRYLKSQCETLDRLHASLVDDDDASLAGQLKGLRAELSDRHRSQREKLETLARSGEGQAKSLDGLLEAQERAASARERIEAAVVAAEAASRDGAAALAENLPKVLEASAVVAAGTERLDEHLQHFAERSETLAAEGNATAERLLDAVGPDASSGIAGDLRLVRDTVETSMTRADERSVELLGKIEHQGTVADEQLLELREQRANAERLIECVGESEEGSLSGELRALRGVAEDSRDTQTANLERLIALSEAGEASFTDALALGREGLDAAARTETLLRERMEEIVGLLSRSPTEEIIEALKTTIREFNEHIAEQFGDNFKQLNEAVGRLLDWQDNYREQLGDMSRQYEAGVQAITDTERSVEEISRHSAAIPTNMEKLGTILAANDSELGQLREHLDAFAKARDLAVQAVPEITKIVGDTVTGLDQAGRSLSSGVQSSAETMTSAIQKSADDYTRVADALTGTVQTTTQRTQDETARLFSSLEGSIKETYRLTSESTENLVKQEFSQMETVREEQTKRVMEEMGVALASITGKFTEDYARLVEAMDRVVRTGSSSGREAA